MARTLNSDGTPKGKKMGRPSSYKPEYVQQAKTILAQTGCTTEALATILNTSIGSIKRWMVKHKDFRTAVKEGRWSYDTKHVVKSLRKRATGYEYDEVHEEAIILKVDGIETCYVEKKTKIRTGETENGKPIFKSATLLVEGIKRKIVHKQIAPSDVACMFWLCNRDSEAWKNVQRTIVEGRHKHEHTKKDSDYDGMSKKDLHKMRELAHKGLAKKLEEEPEKDALDYIPQEAGVEN